MKARDRLSRNSSPWTPPPRQKRREGRGDSWKRLSTTRQPEEITRTRGRSGKRAHSAHRLVENEAALIAASILEQTHETFEADSNSRATGFPERLFHVSRPPDRSSPALRRMPPTRLHPEDQPPQKRVNSSPLCKDERTRRGRRACRRGKPGSPFTGRDRFARFQQMSIGTSILNLLSAFTPNVSPAGRSAGPEAKEGPSGQAPSFRRTAKGEPQEFHHP